MWGNIGVDPSKKEIYNGNFNSMKRKIPVYNTYHEWCKILRLVGCVEFCDGLEYYYDEKSQTEW